MSIPVSGHFNWAANSIFKTEEVPAGYFPDGPLQFFTSWNLQDSGMIVLTAISGSYSKTFSKCFFGYSGGLNGEPSGTGGSLCIFCFAPLSSEDWLLFTKYTAMHGRKERRTIPSISDWPITLMTI